MENIDIRIEQQLPLTLKDKQLELISKQAVYIYSDVREKLNEINYVDIFLDNRKLFVNEKPIDLTEREIKKIDILHDLLSMGLSLKQICSNEKEFTKIQIKLCKCTLKILNSIKTINKTTIKILKITDSYLLKKIKIQQNKINEITLNFEGLLRAGVRMQNKEKVESINNSLGCSALRSTEIIRALTSEQRVLLSIPFSMQLNIGEEHISSLNICLYDSKKIPLNVENLINTCRLGIENISCDSAINLVEGLQKEFSLNKNHLDLLGKLVNLKVLEQVENESIPLSLREEVSSNLPELANYLESKHKTKIENSFNYQLVSSSIDDINNTISNKKLAIKRAMELGKLEYDESLLDLCDLIISNPAEIPIDPLIIKKSDEYQAVKNKTSLFETTIFKSDEEKLQIRTKQLIFLRKIQLSLMKDKNQIPPHVLIAGAGPGGLIRAILAALSGCNVTVIEKRSKESEERPNVLVLGKDTGKDLQILEFLGVTQKIKDNLGSFYGLVNVQIDHLVYALKDTLFNIMGEECIKYEHAIRGVSRNKTMVCPYIMEIGKEDYGQLKNQKLMIEERDMLNETDVADIIVIADGAHSETSHLFGVEKLCLAEKTDILISTFTQQEDISLFDSLSQIIVGAREGINLVQKKYPKTGNILFTVPGKDYLIKGVKDEDMEKPLYKNLQKLNSIKRKIKLLQRSINQNYDSKKYDRLIVLKEEKKALWNECKSEFEAEVKEARAPFDALNLFSSYDQIRFEVEEPILLSVSMHRARVPSIQIGKMAVLICGDAMQDIDPIAGAGAKNAIESSVCFANFLSCYKNKKHATAIDLTKYDLGNNHHAQKTLDESFKWRNLYKRGTENTSRALEVLLKVNPDAFRLEEFDILELSFKKMKILQKCIDHSLEIPRSCQFFPYEISCVESCMEKAKHTLLYNTELKKQDYLVIERLIQELEALYLLQKSNM